MPRRGDPDPDDMQLAALARIEAGQAEIAGSLAVIMQALSVSSAPKKEPSRMSNEHAEALKAKVAEKKTVFDGLVAARDDLAAKLQEARDATGMADTNKAIDDAIAMLDTLVDPTTKTSPVLDNTAAASTPDASPAPTA